MVSLARRFAAYMDQFENGRTVLKQHQKFAIYCMGRMEATTAKLAAVLDAGACVIIITVFGSLLPAEAVGWLLCAFIE